MDQLYRDQILEHYKRPLNWGSLESPTHFFRDRNPLCGDELRVGLVIEKGLIKDLKFEGQGCAISIAAASLNFQELIGNEVQGAITLKAQDIIELLGIEISPIRRKCALLHQKVLIGALTGNPSWPE